MKSYFYILLPIILFSCSKQDPEPPKSAAKSIRSFIFTPSTPSVTVSLDSVQQTITASFPIGSDLTKLVPTIGLSEKATIAPASGVVQDFSKPVSYTVTAEDGSSRIYTTKFSVQKSSARSILTFKFNGLTPAVTASIDSVNWVITANVPANTDLTKLTPTITFSARATLSPASGLVQNFSKAVVYTVTAESGETRNYTVQVSTTKSSANYIKNFYFDDLFPNGIGGIDTVKHTIIVVAPVGTNLSKLKPTIEVANKATVSPSSGTELNFQNGQVFTVTAENGSKQQYTAYVTTIADQPLTASIGGNSYAWKTALCSLTSTPANNFSVQLYNKDLVCSNTQYSFPFIKFDIPISGLGTFITTAYFADAKTGKSYSYFYSVVQVTNITDKTIEGKIIAGNPDDGNRLEGNFVAQLCL